MVLGRKKGILSSWRTKAGGAGADPLLAARVQKLDSLQKILVELRDSMRLYLSSWQTMCKASEAIAEGLATLAGDGEAMEVSPLLNVAQMYYSAHKSIDGLIRDPAQSVAEDTTMRDVEALLSRFPPIYRKIARRRQLLADVEAAESRVRAAEAVKSREKDGFAAAAGAEHRRRMTASLETAEMVAEGVAQEVIADVDRLEGERATMLVPQVSELVGCEAYFMRRSAVALERLASQLPYSALALARLVRPNAPNAGSSSLACTASREKSSSNPDGVVRRPPPPLFLDSQSTGEADGAELASTRLTDAPVPGSGAITRQPSQQASPGATSTHVSASPVRFPDQSGVKSEASKSWHSAQRPPPTYETAMSDPLQLSVSVRPPPPLPPKPASASVLLAQERAQGADADVWRMVENDADDQDVEVTW